MALEIISLGAGVQSSVMALMAARGELKPMPECAIFADTGWEPDGVYKHLEWLKTQLNFPVYNVSAGDIRKDTLDRTKRSASMPVFTENGGMIMRQCTTEYKINPIRKRIRELIGLKPRQRAPKTVTVHVWIGISTDEALRMKPSRDAYVENKFPLIDARLSRTDCVRWFELNYPDRKLAKSACIGCPFHNDVMWRDMKLNDPKSFADAVAFDGAMRSDGNLWKMKEPAFLHRTCKPLADVDLRNLEDLGQLNFFTNECEGMCGV